MLYRDSFPASELERVDESAHVILASGGPLMKLVCFEGDSALCEWSDGDKTRRKLFPLVGLRQLMRLDRDKTIDAEA